jgi:hypothetical protein
MSELTMEQFMTDSKNAVNKSPVGWNPVRERHYKQFLNTLDWYDFGKHDAVRRHMYETWITKGVHPSELRKPHHVGKWD